VVTASGQAPPGAPKGSTVSTLNAPFTDGNGKVGFTGNLTPSNNFVWYDTGIVWLNSDGAPDVLSGAEGTMGVSNTGDFVYSPSVNSNDAVWTANGLLLQETDAAPGFAGMFSSFNSRPIMLPDGTAYWMGGIAATQGGATANRVFYKATPGGGISAVFAGGDVIDGFTLSTGASNFAYWVSDNTAHHIHVVTTTDVAAANDFVLVDGSMAHREGDPTGQGANWQVFTGLSINNSGNYVFGGDDSGAAATDAFIAYNGTILVREGDVVDGVATGGFSVRWVSINNDDRVVYLWGSGTNEHLFEGDGATLGSSSLRILSTNENVDTDGDSVADATVTDFQASAAISPGLDYSDYPFIYVEVDLLDIATQITAEAIIKVPLPVEAACPADTDDDGDVDVDDLLAVIRDWGPCAGCAGDIDGDGDVDVDDLLALIGGWGACP
jgi:hypothetical protein